MNIRKEMKIMKVKINNNYNAVMLVPSINFWYDDDPTIFIGWLFWGIDIVVKKRMKETERNICKH